MVAREGFVYKQKALSVTRNVVVREGWSLVRVVVRHVFYYTGWPDSSGDLGKLDCIQYVGDNDLCIGHIEHTEADVIVEEMGAFNEDGALITVMMQMQPFRNYLLERTA